MQRLPAQLAATELTTASVIQYTAEANTYTQISQATATNKTATARYVTVTITPSGGTARNVSYQQIIPAKRTVVLYGLVGQTIDPAGAVNALAEANAAIDFVMSGFKTNP